MSILEGSYNRYLFQWPRDETGPAPFVLGTCAGKVLTCTGCLRALRQRNGGGEGSGRGRVGGGEEKGE